jgi:hypothetical protein
MSAQPTLPEDVLRALEQLENATSATELGPAYRTLQQWQRGKRRWKLKDLVALAWTLSPLAFLVVLEYFKPTEFERGFLFATVVFAIASLFQQNFLQRRSPAARIEEALARWRHMVPAMRELPD